MKEIKDLRAAMSVPAADRVFAGLYGETAAARRRYLALLDRFSRTFPDKTEAALFSTPGRTEVGGNHTDHNGGHVLAGAVDLDVVAAAAKQNGAVTICSEGYPPFTVSLSELERRPEELGTSAALVRGVCARFRELGYRLGGFCAVMHSTVLKGSGLSSSAAFEVQIANILNHLYNGGALDPVTQAKIAQYAENEYFGKPCGLMDMSACAAGGLLMIDFQDFEAPLFEQVDFDFADSGCTMVIVDTGGDHADMTDDYIALEHEMKAVARALGREVLRQCTKAQVLENLTALRRQVSDRAILRAIHFFEDDERVLQQAQALRRGDMDAFLRLITASGRSSWELCQNCYSHKHPESQGISIALEVTRDVLRGEGAWRVHGGGFAGTIQAFVPDSLRQTYVQKMTQVFGEGAVFQSRIRREGAMEVLF